MTMENIGLFTAIGAKMDYLDQRQRVISQNVANADTPHYKPHDLKPVDFGRVLKETTGEPVVRPYVTNDRHMPKPNTVPEPEDKKDRDTYEVAPSGNAVVMEEQMIKASKNTMDYNLMTSVYQKNMNMLRTALGRGG